MFTPPIWKGLTGGLSTREKYQPIRIRESWFYFRLCQAATTIRITSAERWFMKLGTGLGFFTLLKTLATRRVIMLKTRPLRRSRRWDAGRVETLVMTMIYPIPSTTSWTIHLTTV